MSFLYAVAFFLVAWPIIGLVLAMIFLDDSVMKQMEPEKRKEASAGVWTISLMIALGLSIMMGIIFSRHH